MPTFLMAILLSAAAAETNCPDSYTQLMQLFGRSVRHLGEWSEGRGDRSRDEVLKTLRQARHCAEVSASGASETLRPRGYEGALLARHAEHMRMFVDLLAEAEKGLCETLLSPQRLKEIEERLWRAAHSAHEELFAGKSRQGGG